MEQNRNIVIISRSNSGKTVMIKNLIYYYITKYTFHSIILYSKTAKYETEYNYIDPGNIFDGDLDEMINKILDWQKDWENKMKLLFIVDDPDLWNKWKKLDSLFTMGRHFNITSIIWAQYTKNLIWATVKNNMHYLLFNQVSYTWLETIYDSVFIKTNKREFFEYIFDIKEQYTFVFYKNGGNIDECFKLCKAKIINYNVKF